MLELETIKAEIEKLTDEQRSLLLTHLLAPVETPNLYKNKAKKEIKRALVHEYEF